MTVRTQTLPSQSESTTHQQPNQDHHLGPHPMPTSNQTQKSLVQAHNGARGSEIELHSAVELQSCASELLYAIASLSTTLSQHQPAEDAFAGDLYMAVIQALSDQVRLLLKDLDALSLKHVVHCVEQSVQPKGCLSLACVMCVA